MAVFMQNICVFSRCGVTFPTLRDLILHIESTHIDRDPAFIKRKELEAPSSIPMTYVLPFFTEISKEIPLETKNESTLPSPPMNTATDSIANNNPSVENAEDSNDSMGEEFNIDHAPKTLDNSSEKPFGCSVPGCKKRYKNVNGIKYHTKNGHKDDGQIQKDHRCHCGRSYKTASGLRTHMISHHQETQVPNNYMQMANIQSPLTPRSVGSFTPPSPMKAPSTPTHYPNIFNRYAHPSHMNSKHIRAALEGVKEPTTAVVMPMQGTLPPFNMIQQNADYYHNGFVDTGSFGMLTPAASPRPLSADKGSQMQYPHAMMSPNPGYPPRTPNPYYDTHYYAMNNVMI